ncbi:ribokinase [Georgenia muralis]|uniref:Ribokinase n=1 Tax=Georgenia muralis TaxID=154117 RepID=A0A3N4YYJ6_9MICO|nr:ribokinase [Georgenia muralis]RPF26239.1 ribokinase [Georgenia muralis]
MSESDVVVIGSANADLILEIDHRPRGGETILGSDLVVMPGGKGANQAVAAGRLGAGVAFIGCVGPDAYGQMLRTSLAEAGVDTGRLHVADLPSANAIILVTPDGENSIIVSPGANRRMTPELLDGCRATWAGAAIVVLQLEIPLDTVAHVATHAHRAGSRVLVNAAPAAMLDDEVLALCDPLVVNESEADFLVPGGTTGMSPAEMTDALLALGPLSVVVTLGAGGAVHAERGGDVVRTPAHRVQAVDTTGAGDAFVGALAAELAAGADLAGAVTLANEVAAVAVGRRGAQASYPWRAELGR